MKISFKQLFWAGVIFAILFVILSGVFFKYAGLSGFDMLKAIIFTMLTAVTSHFVMKDSLLENAVLYNRDIFRHFLLRILLFVFGVVLLLVFIYLVQLKSNDSVGAGYLIFFAMMFVFGAYLGFVVIEAIILLFKKRYRKLYCNLILLALSIVLVMLTGL